MIFLLGLREPSVGRGTIYIEGKVTNIFIWMMKQQSKISFPFDGENMEEEIKWH